MELFELTAARAADLIRRRELSPVDLVEALLRRIDALDSAIMAWETLDPEGAMAAARRSEQSAGDVGTGPLHAQRLRRQIRPRIEGMLTGVDCLLLPTVSEVAPEPGNTGDASFQAVWTLFGLPSISLPSGLNSERLPMGTQLVAASFREDKLLSAAAWCEAMLEPLPSPC